MAAKKSTKSRFILFFVILAIVATLVLVGTKFGGGSLKRIVYLIGSGITGTAEQSTISFDSNDANRFHAISGGFAVLSTDGVKIYSLDGKEKFFAPLSYHTPTMVGSKKQIAAYDRNGKQYTVINKKKIIKEGETSAPIINMSMNNSGAYSIVTAGPDCKALVTVYSAKSKELYKLYSTEQYILSAPVSQNGKVMATLGFSASSGQFNGIVSFYDLNTDGAKSSVSLPDCMPISASFMQNGALTVLCEDRLLHFSRSGELTHEAKFDGRSISRASLTSRDISTVLLNAYNLGGHTSLMISDGAKSPVTKEFSEDIFDISCAGNYTAILLNNRIDVYTKNGEFYHSFPLAQSAKNCIMREDGTVFAVGQNYANLLIP